MKTTFFLFVTFIFLSCEANQSKNTHNKSSDQSSLKNDTIKKHAFLDCMYNDSYFPKSSVDKCRDVLLHLCNSIEKSKPENLEGLYKLTRQSTSQINNLKSDFENNDSEIETGARECLAMEFDFIAKTYGFQADVEEMISNRDW